jgi:hypothetical protein
MVLHALAVALSLFLARPAHAVTIEGFTPAGDFKTVFVSPDGRLYVETATGAVQHVIVDSGTINAIEQGLWYMGIYGLDTSGGSLPVTVVSSVTVTIATGTIVVQPLTSTATITGENTVTGPPNFIPQLVYPADNLRKQGTLCNEGPATIRIGAPVGSPVSPTAWGMPFVMGQCYSPDNPSSFRGEIDAVSTATAVVSYFYNE